MTKETLQLCWQLLNSCNLNIHAPNAMEDLAKLNNAKKEVADALGIQPTKPPVPVKKKSVK
jgi:hypothetical protein